MSGDSHRPEYTGVLAKYPGIISTIVTIVIGGVFLGGLYRVATAEHASHGHDDHAAGEHHGDSEDAHPDAAGDGH